MEIIIPIVWEFEHRVSGHEHGDHDRRDERAVGERRNLESAALSVEANEPREVRAKPAIGIFFD
jgi:hypothetical protein